LEQALLRMLCSWIRAAQRYRLKQLYRGRGLSFKWGALRPFLRSTAERLLHEIAAR